MAVSQYIFVGRVAAIFDRGLHNDNEFLLLVPQVPFRQDTASSGMNLRSIPNFVGARRFYIDGNQFS